MPRMNKSLSHEELLAALDYDPATGAFTRKRPGRGVTVGKRADYIENNGYRYVNMGGRRLPAAGLAWFYVNGVWPDRYLRQLDDDKTNVAIANLAHSEFDLSTAEGRRAYNKAYRARDPQARRAEILKPFGLSVSDYQIKFVEQGGCCAICQKPETDTRNGQVKWLAVDHDHETQVVRGLLCAACNTALGKMQDDPNLLRRAASYLDRHAGAEKVITLRVAGGSQERK